MTYRLRVSCRVIATILAVCSVGSAAAGCRTEKEEGAQTEASALRTITPAEIVGTIASGQTSAPIHYQAPPQYRALSFVGSKGDAVDAWVRSSDGDALAFITNARWKSIANNDDADASTMDSHLTAVLPEDGAYYVVFRERDSEPATFTVSLSVKSAAVDGVITTPNANGKTTVSGTVYDPAGKTPLYGVIVYVPTTALAPMVDGPAADPCSAARSGTPVTTAITGADGRFVLDNVPAGVDVPLVIQSGKWRRKVAIKTVTAGSDHLVIDKNLTRLPKNHTEGDIPKIAITTGGCDAVECLIRDVGVEDAEFTAGGGAGRIQLYATPSSSAVPGGPTAEGLWADPAKLATNDMLLGACQCAEYENTKPATSLANIVAYADAGGRIFASHYEAYALDPTRRTPDAVAPWKGSAQWNPSGYGAFTAQTSIDTSSPKGSAFADWLLNVGASTTRGTLPAEDLRYDVLSVNASAKRWVSGPAGDVFLFSFQTPLGEPDVTKHKGKVLFSDQHSGGYTSGGAFPAECTSAAPVTAAALAQRKAFEFMLFELGSCIQDDDAGLVVPPVGP